MSSNKKAILVVSFGTSYPETRKKTIEATENKISKAYPDYDIKRAFTSKMVIKKIGLQESIEINTPQRALDDLIAQEYTDVIIQSLHIINGYEYHDLAKLYQHYKSRFSSLKLGSVLLNSSSDYIQLVEIIMKNTPWLKHDEALVLMGHGTHHSANSAYPALNYVFLQKGYEHVFVGTVEGYPELPEIIDFLSKKSFKKVHLMPLMLVAGDHAINDMAGDEDDSWKSVLEEAGFEVEIHLHGLGELPEVQDIFISHIEDSN